MERKLTIRLSNELYEEMRAKAEREAVNLSALIRKWLTEWVKEDKPPPKDKRA